MKFLLGIIILLAVISTVQAGINDQLVTQCKNDCKTIRNESLSLCNSIDNECKSSCSPLNTSCKRACSLEKSNCMKETNKQYRLCQKNCTAIVNTCMNGTYQKGETFTQGCNVCECRTKGVVSCKREPFCNKAPLLDKTTCIEGNGFYYALCNGPYFSIVCSQKNYCLCNGNMNASCPERYECLTDFVSPNSRVSTVGWKTLLGEPLGDIGVCVSS